MGNHQPSWACQRPCNGIAHSPGNRGKCIRQRSQWVASIPPPHIFDGAVPQLVAPAKGTPDPRRYSPIILRAQIAAVLQERSNSQVHRSRKHVGNVKWHQHLPGIRPVRMRPYARLVPGPSSPKSVSQMQRRPIKKLISAESCHARTDRSIDRRRSVPSRRHRPG